MRAIKVEQGIIFCIPLFMPRDDWKLKTKLSDADLDNDFAFGRVIETFSSVQVEIFKKIGSAKTDVNEIVNSGILFSPVSVFWDGIVKKRWRIIGRTENYDKFKDSNYAALKKAYPPLHDDTFRLLDLATNVETPISRDELMQKGYESSVVWFPINLENRILQALGNELPAVDDKCAEPPQDISEDAKDYVAVMKNEDMVSMCFYNESPKPFAIGVKMNEIHNDAYMNGYGWEALFKYYLLKHAPDVLVNMTPDPEAGLYAVIYYGDDPENEARAGKFAEIVRSLIDSEEELYRIVREEGDLIEWD